MVTDISKLEFASGLFEKLFLFTDNFLHLDIGLGFDLGFLIVAGWLMYFIGMAIAHLIAPGGS